MPISEDEFDTPTMQEPQINTMSKAAIRKTHKPIMEKRRRARINNCLNEIKDLILEAMNKDPARHTKLEKADILEMAVKHLQNVQRQQLAIAIASDPTVIRKFKNGFNDCASEIDRFITKSDNTESGIRDRVTNHLQKCISGLEHVAQYSIPAVANTPFVPGNGIFSINQNAETQGGMGDQNNNPRIQMPQGLQLIPSRLPTGELALLVPNSSNLPYFSSHAMPHRHSAFATVTPQNAEPPKLLSPPLSPVEPPRESPKGFRPLQSNISRPKPSYPGEDHQVPQISSTVGGNLNKHHFTAPMEVKMMKFPIHKPLEKERKLVEHTSVIRKLSEPLCVITNQGERYKQAQQKEDSVFLEENQLPLRGVKRDYSEMLQQQGNQGILTTTTSETFVRPTKIIKTSHHIVPTSTYVRPVSEFVPTLLKERTIEYPVTITTTDVQETSSSLSESSRLERFVPLREPSYAVEADNEPKGDQNDMWRPW